MKRGLMIATITLCVVVIAFGRELLGGLRFNDLPKLSETNFVSSCPSIDTSANMIVDGKGSLNDLMKQFAAIRRHGDGDRVITILHIGDSHIQGGFLSESIRANMCRDFGNAGRGIVTPTALAKTNGGRDYKITSPNRWSSVRCLERDNADVMGATCMGIMCQDQDIEFTIEAKEAFSIITVLHHEKAPRLIEPEEFETDMGCPLNDNDRMTSIALNRPVEKVTLRGRATEEFDKNLFYGFMLENGNGGVLYNAVGVNGASFLHYDNDRIIGDILSLRPDLVIVSLGTNDGFGYNFSESNVAAHIEAVMSKILAGNVPVIMTTPMACCMRGDSRGRRVSVVNKNMAKVSGMIVDYAKSKGLAYWDFYSVAGGDNAPAAWYKQNLVRPDKVHLTVEGYDLQGQLFYSAFLKSYNGSL